MWPSESQCSQFTTSKQRWPRGCVVESHLTHGCLTQLGFVGGGPRGRAAAAASAPITSYSASAARARRLFAPAAASSASSCTSRSMMAWKASRCATVACKSRVSVRTRLMMAAYGLADGARPMAAHHRPRMATSASESPSGLRLMRSAAAHLPRWKDWYSIVSSFFGHAGTKSSISRACASSGIRATA